MTDIGVGEARWSDLVRQIALRLPGRGTAENLRRAIGFTIIPYRTEPPAAIIAAFRAHISVDADSGDRRRSRAFENLSFKHNPDGLKYNLGECGRSSRVTH